MTPAVPAVDWLPAEVLAREGVRARIARAVGEWSTMWFSQRRLTVKRLEPASRTGARAPAPERPVSIQAPKPALGRLVGWALDAQVDAIDATDIDRQVVEAFERRLVEDLARAVEQALGKPAALPAGATAPGGVVAILGEEAGPDLVSAVLSYAAVLPLARADLGAPQRRRVALGALAEALGPTPVTVEAVLGHAEIPLAELKGLAKGDVLVLDRRLDEALELSVRADGPGAGATFARARLTDADGRMALTLTDRREGDVH